MQLKNQSLLQFLNQQRSMYPWRVDRTPYKVFVSEFMLQQTTVQAVTPIYIKFINHYDSLERLSLTSEDEVLIFWKGLGYYRRARFLHRAAHFFQITYQEIPQNLSDLLKSPGIGFYTSRAILSIGYDQHYLALDGNWKRVMSRFFSQLQLPWHSSTEKDLNLLHDQLINQEWISNCLESIGARSLNELIMDVGRLFCRPKSMFCNLCPLSLNCSYSLNSHGFFLKDTQNIYTKKKNAKKSLKQEKVKLNAYWVRSSKGVFIYQREQSQWNASQWEIPMSLEADPSFIQKRIDKCEKEFRFPIDHFLDKINGLKGFKSVGKIKHAITEYIFIVNIFFLDLKEIDSDFQLEISERWLWLNNENHKSIPLSTFFRKVQKIIQEEIPS
jgi:A/G-specific adenine glycosylase